MEALAESRGISRRTAEEVVNVMFDGMREQILALGGMDETLLGIITMKSRRGLNRVVDAYDIRQYFQVLKSSLIPTHVS